MANDVYGILYSNVEAVSGETYETEEVIDEESFLRNVITPIYQVIRKVSISKSLMLYTCIFLLGTVHYLLTENDCTYLEGSQKEPGRHSKPFTMEKLRRFE